MEAGARAVGRAAAEMEAVREVGVRAVARGVTAEVAKAGVVTAVAARAGRQKQRRRQEEQDNMPGGGGGVRALSDGVGGGWVSHSRKSAVSFRALSPLRSPPNRAVLALALAPNPNPNAKPNSYPDPNPLPAPAP